MYPRSMLTTLGSNCAVIPDWAIMIPPSAIGLSLSEIYLPSQKTELSPVIFHDFLQLLSLFEIFLVNIHIWLIKLSRGADHFNKSKIKLCWLCCSHWLSEWTGCQGKMTKPTLGSGSAGLIKWETMKSIKLVTRGPHVCCVPITFHVTCSWCVGSSMGRL